MRAVNALSGSAACRACNTDKGGLSIAEWFDVLVWTADPRAARVAAIADEFRDEIGRASKATPQQQQREVSNGHAG